MSGQGELAVRLPGRSFFAFTFPCPYRRRAPTVDGRLTEWRQEHRLPDTNELDGRPSFADFSASWNEQGLHFACRVAGKTEVVCDEQRWWEQDCLEVWLDMRDNRTIHRATRFCHQFCFIPQDAEGRPRSAKGWQVPIARATEPGPLCDPSELGVASLVGKTYYTLEVVIPREALFGFDPAECSRLGFTYHLNDHELGTQSATVGKEFPIYTDPSLWGTLALVR